MDSAGCWVPGDSKNGSHYYSMGCWVRSFSFQKFNSTLEGASWRRRSASALASASAKPPSANAASGNNCRPRQRAHPQNGPGRGIHTVQTFESRAPRIGHWQFLPKLTSQQAESRRCGDQLLFDIGDGDYIPNGKRDVKREKTVRRPAVGCQARFLALLGMTEGGRVTRVGKARFLTPLSLRSE